MSYVYNMDHIAHEINHIGIKSIITDVVGGVWTVIDEQFLTVEWKAFFLGGSILEIVPEGTVFGKSKVLEVEIRDTQELAENVEVNVFGEGLFFEFRVIFSELHVLGQKMH